MDDSNKGSNSSEDVYRNLISGVAKQQNLEEGILVVAPRDSLNIECDGLVLDKVSSQNKIRRGRKKKKKAYSANFRKDRLVCTLLKRKYLQSVNINRQARGFNSLSLK